MKIISGLFLFCLTALMLGALNACGSGSTPLDAETRSAIDSTATAQIGKARTELDSLCVANERTQMAHLVDSIKKVRLQEINQQLKSVPK